MRADALGDYLSAIGKIPLLTAAEEVHLGTLVQRLMQYPGGPDTAPRHIQRAGKRAKERMIKANLRLVIPLARKYGSVAASNGLDLLDLIQEGAIGLNRAVEKFDPTCGYKFSTYGYWWIRQGVARVATAGGTIKVSSVALQLVNRVRRTQRELGPLATFTQACEHLGEDPVRVAAFARDLDCARCTSLDAPVRDGGPHFSDLGDLIPDPQSDPSAKLDSMDYEVALQALCDVLPDDVALLELEHQGAKRSELATLMDTSPSGLRKKLDHATERVRLVGEEVRELLAA